MDPDKKKKIIMWSLIGLGVIAVVLAIVLPLTLIGGGGDDDSGKVTPAYDLFDQANAANFTEFNPYRNIRVTNTASNTMTVAMSPV